MGAPRASVEKHEMIGKKYIMNSSNKPVRRTPRAQWHNYKDAEYFVTICTKNQVHYFGEVVEGGMQLTEVGKHAQECIIKMEEIHSEVEIPLYVLMPNHIHMIIKLDGVTGSSCTDDVVGLSCADEVVGLSYHGSRNESDMRLPQCDSPTVNGVIGKNPEMQRRANCCGRLSYLIGQFKSAVTKFAHANRIPFAWQSRYHDHIIRNQNEMNIIAQYIEQNPLKWELDCFNDKGKL